MSEIDVAALRAAAERATSGGWVSIGSSSSQEEFGHKPGSSATCIAEERNDMSLVVECSAFGRDSSAEVAYIAAANPAVVLELLDELTELRAMRDRVARVQGRLRAPDKTLVSRVLQPTYELIADLLDGKTEETR